MKFAEIYFDNVGERVFDVRAEDQLVVNDLDVFQFTGGKNIARDKVIQVNVYDGRLDLDFVSVVNNAKLSGIEIAAVEDAPSAPKPEPSTPPGSFTAPFDTSGDAFDLGKVKLYGFGLNGDVAPLETRETVSASTEWDWPPRSTSDPRRKAARPSASISAPLPRR